jgi:hypothetical protein
MRRREFLTLAGAAAAWPVRAQAQRSTMPLIGYVWIGGPGGDEGSGRSASSRHFMIGRVGRSWTHCYTSIR